MLEEFKRLGFIKGDHKAVMKRLHSEGYNSGNSGIVRVTQREMAQTRREARAYHLARMIMKGTPYHRVEQSCHEAPPWGRVKEILIQELIYGTNRPQDMLLDAFLKLWKR